MKLIPLTAHQYKKYHNTRSSFFPNANNRLLRYVVALRVEWCSEELSTYEIRVHENEELNIAPTPREATVEISVPSLKKGFLRCRAIGSVVTAQAKLKVFKFDAFQGSSQSVKMYVYLNDRLSSMTLTLWK